MEQGTICITVAQNYSALAMFFYGFLTAWVLLGLLALVSDEFQWGIMLFDGWTSFVLVLPWAIVILPIKWVRNCIRRWKKRRVKKAAEAEKQEEEEDCYDD